MRQCASIMEWIYRYNVVVRVFAGVGVATHPRPHHHRSRVARGLVSGKEWPLLPGAAWRFFVLETVTHAPRRGGFLPRTHFNPPENWQGEPRILQNETVGAKAAAILKSRWLLSGKFAVDADRKGWNLPVKLRRGEILTWKNETGMDHFITTNIVKCGFMDRLLVYWK